MGKNQHVTPHPDGGWQVKGEGNVRATVHHGFAPVHKKKQLILLVIFRVIKGLNWLYTDPMVKLEIRIHMDGILFRQEVSYNLNNTQKWF